MKQANRQPKSNAKLYAAMVVVVAAAAAAAYWVLKPSDDTPTVVTITAVNPNYTTIQVPTTVCQNVTNTKLVKNKNSNWFSSTFDSKNHPKYVEQSSTHRVCQHSSVESQVINGYTVVFQLGQFTESMQTQTPPALNAVMPLTELQKYQHESHESQLTS